MLKLRFLLVATVTFSLCGTSLAQEPGSGTRNIRSVGHVPLGSFVRADATAWLVDVAVDQRPDKPFVYAAEQSGWAMIDVSEPANPELALVVTGEYMAERGTGFSSIDYLELDGRDIVLVGSAQAVHVYDVTDVGSGSDPEELGTVEGAFGQLFAYRHSSGEALVLATSGGNAMIYRAADLAAGEASAIAEVPTPEQPDSTLGYETVFAAFHADTDADRFYGAGAGGYHIYDILELDAIEYVTSASPAAVRRGLSATPSADGRYFVTTAAYRTAPVRIFDLQPAFDGQFPVIRTSVGAWADNWHGFHLRHETRWPYVFVAAADQGLQVFNARAPHEPYTMAQLQTSRITEWTVNELPHQVGGAIAVSVRNHDGLIVVGDQQTGVWLVRLDGFTTWDGRGWGYPNVSSAQDWTNGPDGSSTFD